MLCLRGWGRKWGSGTRFPRPGIPQSNPYAERFMKPLTDALAAYVNKSHNNWDQILRPFLFNYNTRVHSTTGKSPYYLVVGTEARQPTDVILGGPRRGETLRLDDTTPLSELKARLWEEVQQLMKHRSVGRKAAYDEKHLDVTFDPDSVVMVYYEEAHRLGESTKLISKWVGPYRVIEAVNPVTYRVRHINTDKELIAHVNRLRKIQPYIPPKEYSLGIPSSDMSPTADLTIDPGVIPSIGDMPTPVASGDDGEPA
jgi:hypothetical protein